MSHKATNWAVQQRGISPAAKVVLWHLADRHHPDDGCFPSQDRLVEDCEISRRSLNNQLQSLEEAGLICRIQRINPRTNRIQSTRYILGFEDDFTQHVETKKSDQAEHNENKCTGLVQNLHKEAVCKNQQVPCANSGQFRVQNLHTNPVREPVREPCAARAAHTIDFQRVLDLFCEAYPRIGHLEKTKDAFRSAIDGGVEPQLIIDAAKAYSQEQEGNSPQYIAYPENWLNAGRWAAFIPKANVKANDDQILKNYANAIKAGQSWVIAYMTPTKAREIVSRQLVTEDECRTAGVCL